MTDTGKLNTYAALAAFIDEHPTWVLEMNRGNRLHSWWWMRETPTSETVVNVHASAGMAAVNRGKVKRDPKWTNWRSVVYRMAQ